MGRMLLVSVSAQIMRSHKALLALRALLGCARTCGDVLTFQAMLFSDVSAEASRGRVLVVAMIALIHVVHLLV